MSDEMPDTPAPEKPVHRKTPPATPAVQAWLDGEQPREGLATPDEQETADLWARINSEAETLRKRHTPIHVQSKILSSLPERPAVVPVEEPRAALSKSVAVVGGLIVLAVGAAIGFMMVR
ncbi:MAG TPA: hypothetical protein VHM24_11930 [Gemmatimonadaceae bacterium]|nr:hypothetical protein [Gemmatimonadaceae bacterium]